MPKTSSPSNSTQPKIRFWRREPIGFFGLLVAGVSLLLAGSSFVISYLTYYYEYEVIHDVRVSVVDYELNWEPQELSVEVLIANYGNQPEVFTKIAFLLPGSPGLETESSAGPFISRPEQPILERLVLKIPSESEDREKFDGRICLVCDFKGPLGRRRLGWAGQACPFRFDRNDSGQVFRITFYPEIELNVYEDESIERRTVEATTFATEGEEPVPVFSPDTEVPAP